MDLMFDTTGLELDSEDSVLIDLYSHMNFSTRQSNFIDSSKLSD